MSLSNTADPGSNFLKEPRNLKMIFRVKDINCFPNMKRNSQNLDPFVIHVEELGIPRGAENHKKTSRNHQINAVKNNEHLQEPSPAILMAKVVIPVCSPAKEEKKIDDLIRITCRQETLN
ncbi:hypothetical protein TNCT_430131 [Trichonephila clavata]|uniref:Uncharacterized protein n=1 Tax=Trichonephila clavata TaxID=2740835 RepID=A0A8X6FHN4_TRICU|nr:hypothetical protein TNCT_430131 [Trichonephila clavata]